jgi:hypothetical protein
VVIHGEHIAPGSLVRLHPRARADLFDRVLDGKVATVEAVEQDFEGRVQLAVTVEGVEVVDFGIRGFDLEHALLAASDSTAVLVDATPRGGEPGTLRARAARRRRRFADGTESTRRSRPRRGGTHDQGSYQEAL